MVADIYVGMYKWSLQYSLPQHGCAIKVFICMTNYDNFFINAPDYIFDELKDLIRYEYAWFQGTN